MLEMYLKCLHLSKTCEQGGWIFWQINTTWVNFTHLLWNVYIVTISIFGVKLESFDRIFVLVSVWWIFYFGPNTNIFILWILTEYEYIHSLNIDRIRIRIYSFFEYWPNTNTEYTRSQILTKYEYRIYSLFKI